MQKKFDKIIIAIVGSIGAGKGTVASYLERRYGARVFRFSTPLRHILEIMDQDINRENMQLLSKVLRESFGQNLIAQIAAHDMAAFDGRISICDGARRLEDIEGLIGLPNFFLIYIEADIEVRYARVVTRAENGGDSEKSYAWFLEEELGEAESRTKSLKAVAHFVVDNSGDESEFTQRVEEIVKGVLV